MLEILLTASAVLKDVDTLLLCEKEPSGWHVRKSTAFAVFGYECTMPYLLLVFRLDAILQLHLFVRKRRWQFSNRLYRLFPFR